MLRLNELPPLRQPRRPATPTGARQRPDGFEPPVPTGISKGPHKTSPVGLKAISDKIVRAPSRFLNIPPGSSGLGGFGSLVARWSERRVSTSCYLGARSSSRHRAMANPLETTAVLLSRAQAGDHDALNQLLATYLPRLNRWAHGRLPNTSRDLADTHDVVQETLINALKRLPSLELTHGAGFQAYLRQSVLNRIRNEIRRTHGQPSHTPLDDQHPDDAQSPLDVVIGRQSVERYEAALARLRPEEQDAIVVRLELGCSYEEVAAALNKPSVDAARMTVRRAIARLVMEMGRDAA